MKSLILFVSFFLLNSASYASFDVSVTNKTTRPGDIVFHAIGCGIKTGGKHYAEACHLDKNIKPSKTTSYTYKRGQSRRFVFLFAHHLPRVALTDRFVNNQMMLSNPFYCVYKIKISDKHDYSFDTKLSYPPQMTAREFNSLFRRIKSEEGWNCHYFDNPNFR